MKNFRQILSKYWILPFTVVLITICTIALIAGISMFRAYNERNVETNQAINDNVKQNAEKTEYVKPNLTFLKSKSTTQPRDKDISKEKAVDLASRMIFGIYGVDLNNSTVCVSFYTKKNTNQGHWALEFNSPINDLLYTCTVDSVTGRIYYAVAFRDLKFDIKNTPIPNKLTDQEKNDLQVKAEQTFNDKELIAFVENIVNKNLLYGQSIKESKVKTCDLNLKDTKCYSFEENGKIKLIFPSDFSVYSHSLVTIDTILSDGSCYNSFVSIDPNKFEGFIYYPDGNLQHNYFDR